MKKLFIILLFINCKGYCQNDSTKMMYFSGNGAHNGYCCYAWKDSMMFYWSYKRKEWCLFNDSLYDAYYKSRIGYTYDWFPVSSKTENTPIGIKHLKKPKRK